MPASDSSRRTAWPSSWASCFGAPNRYGPGTLTAAAIHVLLGTANLVFWQLFIAADMLTVGYVTTALHGLFAALQLLAASTAATSTTGHTRA